MRIVGQLWASKNRNVAVLAALLLCVLSVNLREAAAQITLPGPGIINTIAGRSFNSGNGGIPTGADLYYPSGVAIDTAGNVYIADSWNDVVHKVTVAGTITTVAGNGLTGFSGDGGIATNAELYNPAGVAVDTAGNLYIADWGNCRIRKITVQTNVITTVAGSGTCGYAGDGGSAFTAQLNNPYSVAVDGPGNLYIADYNNNRIRKLTASSGTISTIAGTGTPGYNGEGTATAAEVNYPWGVAVDSSGNVYVADTNNSRIRKVTPTGTISTVAGNGSSGYTGDNGAATLAELNHPGGVRVGSSGNLYIADSENQRVRKVSGGTITTIAGSGSPFFSGDGGRATLAGIGVPSDVAVDSAGNVFIAEPSDNRIREVVASSGVISTYAGSGLGGATSGDGGTATGATFSPYAIALDGAGNVYIGDYDNHVVRKIVASTGIISTLAGTGTCGYSGDGGPSNKAQLCWPTGIAVDKSGNVYIADSGNSVIREITASTGYISTVAGSGVVGFHGSGGPAKNAEFSDVEGLATDSSGNVYIADGGNSVIWEVTIASGNISVVAGTGQQAGYTGDNGAATSATLAYPYGVAVDSTGNVYIADTGNAVIRKVAATNHYISTYAGNGQSGYGGDGGPAKNATLWYPQDVVVDGSGNLYIADDAENRVRVVLATTQYISDYAGNGIDGFAGDLGNATDAEIWGPTGVAVDAAGNVYIADGYNHRIRAVGTKGTTTNPGAGFITTVAGNGTPGFNGDGGSATSAELNYLHGIAVDGSGNIYIVDEDDSVVRKVDAVSGVISTIVGSAPGFIDNVQGVSAKLNFPWDVAADSAGNLYIADSYNNRIRKYNSSTHIVTTVAGNGTAGFSGDGGLATSAELYYPNAVTVDSAGNIYIGDWTNERIRKVTTDGKINTIAGTGQQGSTGDGGPALSAKLNLGTPGMSVDSSGNLYFADLYRIRKLTPSGSTYNISTVAGNGVAGYMGDGGPATSANIIGGGVAVDSSGNLYFADSEGGYNGSHVRHVIGTTISTYAGGGPGCPQETDAVGDGCSATLARLLGPTSVAVDTSKNVYIVDAYDYRVRKVGAETGITKTTPTITWPTPANIPYGAPLSAPQLDATTTVPGTFVYTPPMGTVLSLGSHSLSVTFTPTDTTFYNTANANVTIVVGKAPVPITWPAPANIIYGTALSAVQLDATTTVAGTFSYSPTAGTVLTAGTQSLSTTFTPTDTIDYTTTTVTVQISVNKAVPSITWSQPADIAYGTALSSSQLNASSPVAGSFAYSPAAGAILSTGPHTLSTTFTPSDNSDYVTTSDTVLITVTQGTTTWDSGNITLTVNGSTVSTASYGQGSTPSTIAASLAANASGSAPVYVSAVDDSLYLEAKTGGSSTDYTYSLQTTSWNHAFTNPSFVYPAINTAMDGGANQNAAGTQVYFFWVPTNGYDAVGNLKQYSDPVMGTWTFNYDSLNRLTQATDNQSGNPNADYCWGYDAFGNRSIQAGSNAAFSVGSPVAPGTSPCQPASGASFTSTWANYNTTANNNQFTNTSQATGGVIYDGAGNLTYDGNNQYLYDAEGRVCAVSYAGVPGVVSMTGYIYNAEGIRVAKGSITAWSCDPTLNGFQTINDYVLGPSGEQITEMGVNSTNAIAWQHTNVFAAGKLIGTYDSNGLHFYLNDGLGTRRAQTDYAGVLGQTCASLPFGDSLSCTNSNQFPTEHHFTGKERDTESGNDYFGARYYASTMGRFMSPDWSSAPDTVPYADFNNPQSMNLYSYAGNNPLSNGDPNGHNYHVCDQYGQNCSDQSDADFAQNMKNAQANGEHWGGGKIELADGSAAGTYTQTDVDLPGDAASNRAAAGMIATDGFGAINMFAKNMAYTVAGGLAGRAIGWGFEALSDAAALNTGTNVVYQSVNAAGDVQYVGITGDFEQRAAQHAARFGIEKIPGLSNLARADAQAVEQALIEMHGLASNGGTLLNKINSIASTNPGYARALAHGLELLEKVGYVK